MKVGVASGIRAFVSAVALALSGAAHATLVWVPGQNAGFDTTTRLRWLNVNAASDLTYAELITSTWYADGWRLATGEEVSALFFTYLTLLTTAPSLDADGLPFTAGKVEDFYAPWQSDPSGSTRDFMDLLGGPTISLPGGVHLTGLIDQVSPCTGTCTAHGLASLVALSDGQVRVTIGGGQQDTFAYPYL